MKTCVSSPARLKLVTWSSWKAVFLVRQKLNQQISTGGSGAALVIFCLFLLNHFVAFGSFGSFGSFRQILSA